MEEREKIRIIFSNNMEITTNEVVKWLHSLEKDFVRINENEHFEIKVKNKRILLESSQYSFFLDQIDSSWFRRGGFRFKRLNYRHLSLDMYMNETQYWLEDYVVRKLEEKKHINKQSNNHLNKLLVLEKAKKYGLTVPEYFLSINTNEVELEKTITKSITEQIVIESAFDDCDGILYTAVITEEEQDFFPTFFQEKIEKDYEVRSFYLDGNFWSSAIFSQNDEQTKTDHRKYNFHKPNRCVTYQLPIDIEDKVKLLMQELDINCGSLDFLVKNNEHYFLEINPVGQFLGVSSDCNYCLQKEIALYL